MKLSSVTPYAAAAALIMAMNVPQVADTIPLDQLSASFGALMLLLAHAIGEVGDWLRSRRKRREKTDGP